MRASLLNSTLKSLIQIGRSVAIEGPPGGGKTSIVHQVASDLDLPVVEKHMPTMLVEDFGIPYPDAQGDSFSYKLPDWFPAKGKPGTQSGGVLLFDDRNQANTDLQKVLANIQQARNLHGVPLADGWSVVSTGNRQSDRAGANRVLSHLRNRETVLEFETHLDDSTQWMIDNDVNPMVIAFTRFRPHLLHDFDPQRDVNPTPRSWVEGVSAVLGKVPAEAEYECFKGAIGEGAAAEFVGFARIFRKLPNPDAILLNPDTADVPTDPATLYALSGALAERATEANLERVVTYTSRMPAEFSVLSISYAVRKRPELTNSQAFTRWALAHQDVLF
jgi:hypothetical protein